MPDFITRDEFNETMDELTSTMREVAIRLRTLEVLEHIPLGGGGGAPADAEYVTLSLNAFLTAERVLTAGDGIEITDAGANSTVTIATTCGWHPQATVIAVGGEQEIGATCQVTIAHDLQNDGHLINDGELIIWEPGFCSPAGNDTEIQINVGGVFGAYSEFTFDGEQLYVNQSNAGGAVTVIYLDQDDQNFPFITFDGYGGASPSTNNMTDAAMAGIEGYIKIRIVDQNSYFTDGIQYWIPFYIPAA